VALARGTLVLAFKILCERILAFLQNFFILRAANLNKHFDKDIDV